MPKKTFAMGYAGGIDDGAAGLCNLELYKKGKKQEATKFND